MSRIQTIILAIILLGASVLLINYQSGNSTTGDVDVSPTPTPMLEYVEISQDETPPATIPVTVRSETDTVTINSVDTTFMWQVLESLYFWGDTSVVVYKKSAEPALEAVNVQALEVVFTQEAQSSVRLSVTEIPLITSSHTYDAETQTLTVYIQAEPGLVGESAFSQKNEKADRVNIEINVALLNEFVTLTQDVIASANEIEYDTENDEQNGVFVRQLLTQVTNEYLAQNKNMVDISVSEE